MLTPAGMENELMSSNVRLSRGLASFLIVDGAAGIGGSIARAATGPISGAYVSLGAGVDFQQNEILGAVPAEGAPQRSAHFDKPGFAGEASLGYGFGNGLRVELGGDCLNDHAQDPVSVRLHPPGREQPAAVWRLRQRAVRHTGGTAVHALCRSRGGRTTPGGRQPQLLRAGFQFPRQGGSAPKIDSFAYQAIAGLSLPVPNVRGLALTAEYRFIGLLDPLQAITLRSYGGPAGSEVREGNERLGNVFHHSILFGLRYAFDTAPPAPPPGPAPAMAPAPAAARTYLVFFDWDRSELTARARQIVADAAQNTMHVRTTRLEVDGYADSSRALPGRSGQDYNLRLSLRRTDAVRAELVRDGVAAAAIQVHGYGDTNLLIPTGPNVREPQNRGVEIIVR